MMPADYQADIAAIQRIEAVPRILEVICRTTGMGFSAVARVTEDRWICCAVRDEIEFGLQPGGKLKVATTICDEIRESGEAVVIDNVSEDAVFCGHPTPALYGFQSYISVPIILENGTFFGTLCAIDPRPARLKSSETLGMFKLFAELIAIHLNAIERLADSQAELLDVRRSSELREQFIAVLGHDLRNPLASITAVIRLLPKAKSKEETAGMLGSLQRSVDRMAQLIDNVLDFARGRLGGGLTIERKSNVQLEPYLKQVIAELRDAFPDRAIEAVLAIHGPVDCDVGRISQMLSNLLANALKHGAADKPVHVNVTAGNGLFQLSVANAGNPIPPAELKLLFKPFYRGSVRPSQQGLGLGLYICSEIAKGHGGSLDVLSSPDETRFTFKMPLA
jgi:signal transduction histidine kinase